MSNWSLYFVIASLFCLNISISATNLEGPFLFWGPRSIESFRRPALKSLEQDDLIEIYDKQAAIVVFNNQDSLPLSSENFPRLRKMLESKTILVLPQDFLDVHPDYVNNETQVFTLQGPNSERDAEITETFNRLEDIYGEGKVLAVLGNSVSQDYSDRASAYNLLEDGDENDFERSRREAPAEVPSSKEPNEYALYNASGKALMYTSSIPVLIYASNDNTTSPEEVQLRNHVSTTHDERGQMVRITVTFTVDQGKVILLFRFPSSGGYWSFGEVELSDQRQRSRDKETVVLSPNSGKSGNNFLGARNKFSYHCSLPLTFSNGSVTLKFFDIQVQPQMEHPGRFSDAYDCIGFTTVPIWSGVGVSLFLVFVVAVSISMILDIKTMDRFENAKGKVLTLTISE